MDELQGEGRGDGEGKGEAEAGQKARGRRRVNVQRDVLDKKEPHGPAGACGAASVSP